MTTVSLSGVSMRSSCMRKNGAEPPPASGLRFCSTVNLTSSAVSSPQPSWNFTTERSLNVHVLSSFDGFHPVASPGAVLEGLRVARDQRIVDAVPQGLLALHAAPGERRLGAPLTDRDDEALVGAGGGASGTNERRAHGGDGRGARPPQETPAIDRTSHRDVLRDLPQLTYSCETASTMSGPSSA